MNKHDADNLAFLLHSDEETLRVWYSNASPDDLAYAQELMAIKAYELKDEAVALRVEAELAVRSDYSAAKALLDKVSKP